MRGQGRPPRLEGKLAGFVYLATNSSMPGVVRAGRTQNWPQYRIANLNGANVPEPFLLKAAKFFVDCFAAEEKIVAELSSAGASCENKRFFKIDETLARNILENNYSKQHTHAYPNEYKLEAEAAFEKALVEKRDDWWWQLIVETSRCLPHEEQEEQLMWLLVKALEQGSQDCAQWILSEWRIDPEIPFPPDAFRMGIDLYSLTAYEEAIFHGHSKLENYLTGMGCNLLDSKALCWVIDSLINSGLNDSWKSRAANFGVALLKRKANPDRIMDVTLFANAPRKSRCREFGYGVFPRSSGKTCREVIELYSFFNNPYFVELQRSMY